jgi:hypothetical protein
MQITCGFIWFKQVTKTWNKIIYSQGLMKNNQDGDNLYYFKIIHEVFFLPYMIVVSLSQDDFQTNPFLGGTTRNHLTKI